MRKITSIFSIYFLLIFMTFGLTGCTLIFQKAKRTDANKKFARLQDEYVRLQDEMSELERAKMELEDRLHGEISDNEVMVEMGDRGLIITFVAEVLFASGKANLRSNALNKLAKVSRVLNTTVRDLNVGVEGHTDNIPIKHSGWKSNWELSSARAMSVVHYLIDEHGVDPVRLSATGYGEYHPIADNNTKEGRQRNRRVEIVILPKIEKKANSENLK